MPPAQIVVAFTAMMGVVAGCTTTPNVYSWKPQAAQTARPRPAARPITIDSNMAGADVLEESHRAASVTWIAVPSPDGKKTVWVQMR